MKQTKPLIERYLTYLRVTNEKIGARLKERTGLTLEELTWKEAVARVYNDIYIQMVEQATKYRLAPSATAMINVLCPHPSSLLALKTSSLVVGERHQWECEQGLLMPIWRIPNAPVWIELEESIDINATEIAGFFFTSSDLQIEQQLKKPQSSAAYSVLQAARCQDHGDVRWQLYFVDKHGTPTSRYQYFDRARVWGIPESVPCPSGECTRGSQENRVTDTTVAPTTLCTSCATLLRYWCSWFMTALLALQGEYAVSIEEEWPCHQEQTMRKVKHTSSHKYHEISVQHKYYIVSFDASMKKRHPVEASQQRGESEQQNSWVAATKQIDPESVIYVKHDFAQTIRHLDPERNPRWKQKQTILVKPHSKRLPMKVANLQRRLTRVIASTYED